MRISRRSAAALALTVLLATGCGERAAEEPGEEIADTVVQGESLDPALASLVPAGATFEQAQEGQRLFTVCTVCHGLDARGTALGPSLRDGEWLHVESEIDSIAGLIRSGVSRPREYPVPMPPLGGGDFDDAQIRALATYVYLLSRQEGGE